MRCPYCHQEHPDQAIYCPVTGQPLAPLLVASPSACAVCGTSLPADAQICPVCGAIINPGGTPDQVASNSFWDKSKDYLKLLGYSLLALFILAAVLVITLSIMIPRIGTPFSATQRAAGTPGTGSTIQGSTETVEGPLLTPSMTVVNPLLTPSLTLNNPQLTPSMSVPSQTQPAVTPPAQSWQQGMLAYLVRVPSGFNAIYALNLEKGSPPQLLLQPTGKHHYYGPWLSPDSQKLVFYDLNGSNGILDLQDLSVRLVDACNSPTYSADGKRIICGSGGKFRILDAENGDLLQILDTGMNGWLPVFSPAGTEIAFAVFGNGRSTSIWRMDASGGQPVSLASEPFENYCPAWSPDGNWIVYQSSARNGHSEIWIMDRNGENKRQITSSLEDWSRGPVWSPDGKWLAFVSARSGSSVDDEYGEVFVISLVTGETHQVTDTGGKVDNWRVTWGSTK